MTTTPTTLHVRNTSKNSWSQAARIPMLDSLIRLNELSKGMNEQAGFAKYRVDPNELAAATTAAYANVQSDLDEPDETDHLLDDVRDDQDDADNAFTPVDYSQDNA